MAALRGSSHRHNKNVAEDTDSGTFMGLSQTLALDHHIKPLGRSPRDEEEKRQVYEDLVRLKERRLTNRECGVALGYSERTIANYLTDPYYQEVQNDLIGQAKQRGHMLISEVIGPAIEKLYELMNTANSPFVQYKAAEKLLDVAGYNMPREEQRADSRAGLSSFLEELQRRRGNSVQVNVQVNTHPSSGSSESVVEALPVQAESLTIPAELERYYLPVQPGGKLPIPSRNDREEE